METKHLTQYKNETNSPCVSVIIPTHKTGSGREADILEVSKTIAKSKELLISKYGKVNSDAIINALTLLEEKVDYAHNEDGLGLFVSGSVAEMIKFPFSVKEKISVRENFDIKDLLYLQEYMNAYFLLDISLKAIRLFRASGSHLTEIRDGNFPVMTYDDYEYEKTSLGSSHGYALKSTENDRSVFRDDRFIGFLKKADYLLKSHLKNNDALLISGGAHELGAFNKITDHADFIIGKVTGNYSKNLHQLGELAFEEIKKFRADKANQNMKNLQNAYGKNLAVTGLRDCWQAAQQGKGQLLIVEKDYSEPGFIKKSDPYKLYLEHPADEYIVIEDAVEQLIRKVLQMKGEIMFAENGMLDDYQKIALIERYN